MPEMHVRSPPPAADAVARREKMRSVVENARDYAVVTLDPGGRAVRWTAGAMATFGQPEAGQQKLGRRPCRL